MNFEKNVNYYKERLSKLKGNIFVHGKASKKSFYSTAALSRAAHELGKDISISLSLKENPSVESLFRIWAAQDLAGEFISFCPDIKPFFKPPEIILYAGETGFGDMNYVDWQRTARWEELVETQKNVVRSCYNLKKEKLGLGIALVPDADFIESPLQDYLDSYDIVFAFFEAAKNICSNIVISGSTGRKSMRDLPCAVPELMTTLLGSELSKESGEPVFGAYKKLSDNLGLEFKPNDAVFAIKAKGYHGRHIFGEKIGYPTGNKKSRWPSPGGIIYKFSWLPQSKEEPRLPLCRIGFTQTLPVDIYIDSVNIDYKKMRSRNEQIAEIVRKSNKIVVQGKSNFEVNLIKEDGSKRNVAKSDSDVRQKKDPETEYGMMANIPGGEAFLTPEFIKGKFYGDVIIEIDKSYRLSDKDPLEIDADETGYRIIRGPKEILDKINEKKKDSWKNILMQKKSLPTKITELKKQNFERIGEFAINTNPKARLCDYLIVNEKIANMIHIALGSGFEPDRATEYHMDIVIDAKAQGLDIWGDNGKNRLWILKSGKFVV